MPVPWGLTTLIGPEVAPAGTLEVIWVWESTEKAALVPLNRTSVAPLKAVPEMITLTPTAPLEGLKPLMKGA